MPPLTTSPSLRHWLRAAVYRSPARVAVRSLRRLRGATERPGVHETSAYWNEELAGRMSRPNLNGAMSNALRDMSTVTMVRTAASVPASVLDVGCGFGDLARAFAPFGVSRYRGIDLSDYVIEHARQEHASWPETRDCTLAFEQADLRAYDPPQGERYDLIVFNEVLKYVDVDEAVRQVERYAERLAPGGLLCVNITDDPKCHAIFRALEDRLEWIYGTLYQQRPDGPRFRVTRNRATPAYLTGLFRPAPERAA